MGYTELYVNSIVGELTLETSDYQVKDHTAQLEDSGECATNVDLQKQIDLGLLPMRDDFTPEVNDDAEKILVERPEHLDGEIEHLVGEIFHRHIRERHRKRKLVREYGLVDRFYGKNGVN